MSKPRSQTPVQAAIERVASDSAGPPMRQVPITIHRDAVRLDGETGPITIMAPADGRHPVVLVADRPGGPWRVVLLPPGTSWQLAPAPPPGPKIWLPQ